MKSIHTSVMCSGKIIFLCVISNCLYGCNAVIYKNNGENGKSESFYEALSTHLSVLSIGPWNKYINDLLPHFELNAPQALASVVPRTTAVGEYSSDYTGGNLQLGLQSTTVQKSSSQSSGTGSASSKQRVETVEPGELPAKPSLPSSGDDKSAPQPLPPLDSSGDPILRYSAAASLLQEVTILNKYLEDAAIRKGYTPYVIRLQLSVLPKKRQQPYDVYTDLSFFPAYSSFDSIILSSPTIDAKNKKIRSVTEKIGEGQDMRQISIPLPGHCPDTVKNDSDGVILEPVGVIVDQRLPEVIPLLVTDNLEAVSGSRVQEQIKEFTIAVSAILANSAAGVDIGSRLKQLSEIVGSDINSVFTLAQLSKNAVRVRLGATRSPNSEYSMISRTHNVTLLLLVPDISSNTASKYSSIKIVSRSFIRDAITGRRLPDISSNDIREILSNSTDTQRRAGLSRVWTTYIGPFTFTESEPLYDNLQEKIGMLLSLVGADDYTGFQDCMQKWRLQVDSSVLWLDLLDYQASGGINFREIELPPSPPSVTKGGMDTK